jgi:hypothetical protein
MRRRRWPVFLVVDCHPTHRGKIVSAYIQLLKAIWSFIFFPATRPIGTQIAKVRERAGDCATSAMADCPGDGAAMIAIPAADNRGPLQLSGFDRRSDVNVRNLSGSGQPQGTEHHGGNVLRLQQ